MYYFSYQIPCLLLVFLLDVCSTATLYLWVLSW